MTPQERAEKILDMLSNAYFDIKTDIYKEAIVAQIEEAERKAVKELMLTELSQKQVFKEGWNAAREKAKGIVKETPGNTYTTDCDHDEIADRIAKMEADK